MTQLLAFIRIFKEYIVFTLLCVLSIFLMTSGGGPQVQVLRSYSIAAIALLQQSTSWVPAFGRSDETESLRDVNMTLMEEVMQLRRLRFENSELRKLMGFRQRSVYPLLPAEIVGKNLTLGQTTLTVNLGETDSVRINMPVINEEGLVGKVVAVSAHYSIVQPAVNREFRATARVTRSRVDGIIAWKDGANLLMQNIWKTADVRVGDTVVTSEVSDFFPPEIPVGTVKRIGPGDRGLFSQVDLKPFVNFSSLERVFIVRYRPDAERETLEAQTTGTGARE